MKRWLFLIIVMIIFFANRDGQEKPATNVETVKAPETKSLTDFKTKKFPSRPQAPTKRKPASVPLQTSTPRSNFEVSFGEHPIRVGKSFTVVENMLTVEKSKFNPSLGTKLTENSHFVFFRPASPSTIGSPVAQDQSTQRFFPISSILHVKGVDSTLREQFKSEGMTEFYYHPRMKFVSLEASPETVLKQYQDLTARGYDARLEVLKDPHRPH